MILLQNEKRLKNFDAVVHSRILKTNENFDHTKLLIEQLVLLFHVNALNTKFCQNFKKSQSRFCINFSTSIRVPEMEPVKMFSTRPDPTGKIQNLRRLTDH